jgi:hypothetical protein
MQFGIASFVFFLFFFVIDVWLGVRGPCFEGVGNYPATGPDTQRVEYGSALYVAGDAGGQVRGLVPSFLSGWCVGADLHRRLALLDACAEVAAWGHPMGSGPRPPAPPPMAELGAIDGLFAPSIAEQHLLFEAHIFLGPINPDVALRERYYRVIDTFNRRMESSYGSLWKAMKVSFLSVELCRV